MLTVLIPNSVSAEELGELRVSSKDFYVEGGELKEIYNVNKALLPPLDELIPWDAYLSNSLPSNTYDFPALETLEPIDYLALVFDVNGREMTAEQLYLHAPDADLYVFKTSPDDDGMIMQLSRDEMERYTPGAQRIYPAFGEKDIEVRYYKDHPIVDDQAKVQFVGYWEILGSTVSDNTGRRIVRTYTSSSGVDKTSALELAATVGVSVGLEVGPDWGKLRTELSLALSGAIGYSNTISEYDEVSTAHYFGLDVPNGIPYIGGVYQLKGEYLVKDPGPDLKIRLDFLNTYGDFPAKLKPDFYYDNDHYRQIQADYKEPEA
ncbi:hypothetical protein [Jeotgalibacillus marinus]|uniref:Uncharacterized protein n=1 Tax=Jeotgalibacillus marinus TaxID=86667 RepID=A0ABV3Q631_9BACL